MESPPPLLAGYVSRQSKKRVFPGSSSSCTDPEVVEIPPPMSRSSQSKPLKQKGVVHHEVIDIDMDEDSGEVMLLDEKVDTHNKGKEAFVNFSYSHSNSEKPESVDAVQSSKGCSVPGPYNSFNLEGFNNGFSYVDGDYMDTYHAFLQAHFDSIDIPPGVEAPIPSYSDPAQKKKNPATVSSSNNPSFSIQLDASGADSLHSQGLPELAQTGKKSTSTSNSSLQTHMGTLTHTYGVDLSSAWYFPESSQNKKSASSTSSTNLNLQAEKGAMNHPTEFKSCNVPGFSHSKKDPAGSGSTTNYTSHNQLDAMKLSSGMDPYFKGFYLHNILKKPVGNGSLTNSRFSAMDTMNLLPGVDAYMSEWQGSPVFMNNPSFMTDNNPSFMTDNNPSFLTDGIYNSSDAVHFFSEKELDAPWVLDHVNSQKNATAAGSSAVKIGSTSLIEKHGNENDILTKFQLFKQFDIVQDFSDHHFSCRGYSVMQPSWAKKIQEEWKILEKDLPDTIFVRVYESRMDILRAVIVGAEGTPYHDGLFFFDVFFPCGYPNVPPHVYYHSGGLRINPNLYNCGKVCLSLLNTWSGSQNEMWIPGVSTILQVLVSIQALILNEKPYFNEPCNERMSGLASGEKYSQQYNENTFILSLKTMVYTMRRPPKYFEDFVVGHFCKHAQDILVACNAYIDGAQVGCLVKGGVQDVDAGNNSCSRYFKDTLGGYITVLVQSFSQIGAKDCEKFLSLVEKGSDPLVPSVPIAFSNYFDPMKMQF